MHGKMLKPKEHYRQLSYLASGHDLLLSTQQNFYNIFEITIVIFSKVIVNEQFSLHP